MICLQTPSFGGLFKIAVNWLQNRLITSNELLDPVLFFRSAIAVGYRLCKLPLCDIHIAVIFTAISLKSFFVRVNFYIFNCFFLGESGNRRSKFVFM